MMSINEWSPYYERTGCDMPEFISSPIFLIIAAIFALLLIFRISKPVFRLLIWAVVILAVLVYFGIVKQSELLQWFENLREMVE